ncbi:MAG: hypothetical protein KTR31_32945 [Myxococcales bacterium]|nr:hypothetical protein [Myxococcales bacterium]
MVARSLSLVGALTLWAGCSGGTTKTCFVDCETDTTTTTPDTPTADSSEPDPTNTTPPGDLVGCVVALGFGYDGKGQVTATFDDLTLEPRIEMVLFNQAFTGYANDTQNYCDITIPLDDAGLYTGVLTDKLLWWGLDWDDKKNPYTTTCNEGGRLQLSPDVFNDDDPLAFLTQEFDGEPAEYFAAVGPRNLSPELKAAIAADPDFELDEYDFGCTVGLPDNKFRSNTGALLNEITDCTANAWTLDKNNEIVDIDESRILGEDIFTGNNVVPGYYEFTIFPFFVFGQ